MLGLRAGVDLGLRVVAGLGAASLIALLVVWIPASLAMPLGRDQGIFA